MPKPIELADYEVDRITSFFLYLKTTPKMFANHQLVVMHAKIHLGLPLYEKILGRYEDAKADESEK